MKKRNIDYYTTSNDFKGEGGIYYHKKLDPNKEHSWKKGTILLVRSTKYGIDYIIRFTEDGKEIPDNDPTFDKKLKWKYYAPYEILEELPPDKTKSRKIKKTIREEILLRQNYRCNLCGALFNDKNPYQIDHIKEMSCGGRTKISNLQALCKYGCHALKTFALKKAKQEGLINPYNWNEDHEDFLITFLKKIIRGPLFNQIIGIK